MNHSITTPITVLYIEDNIFHRQNFADALKADGPSGTGFYVSLVSSFDDALNLSQQRFDVVVSDLDLGRGKDEGISYISKLKSTFPDACVIIRSQSDDAETLREVLRIGVDDFISKQSDKLELPLRLARAFELKSVTQGRLKHESTFAIGQTMQRVAGRVNQILHSALTSIHVQGETGTGKEVVADLFEAALPKGTNFIRVNCAAIPLSLMESELFGYAKGAFTGAQNDRMGLFEAANGGWIFLDELASLPLTIQAAILRVLENKEVLRVGSTAARKIQVRVLSASNISIPSLVEKKEFRQDLWQRLSESVIELAPLRERSSEIPELIEHLLKITDGGPYQMTEPAFVVLSAIEWSQGNIRQLRNTIRAMTEYAVGKTLTPMGIPKDILQAYTEKLKPHASESKVTQSVQLPNTLDYEQGCLSLFLQMLKEASAQTGGPLSIRAVAKTLNMSRSAVSDRVEAIKKLAWVSETELTQLVQQKN